MLDLTLLRTLGIMILVAVTCILIFSRFKVPNLVTFIIAGLIIYPIIDYLYPALYSFFGEPLGELQGQELLSLDSIKVISKVGIALLLFLVGLELSLDKIRDVGKVALVAGLGQVIFTAAGGVILALALGFSMLASIVIAVALTFSSTVVVVKLLDQKQQLDSLYGRMAVGIFLVQDLVVILVLTLLAGFESGADNSLSSISISIVKAFIGMMALLALALLSSKYFLHKPFTWASRSSETILLWSLTWCFLFVILAEYFELSLEVGAFLAGLSLAQLNCSCELRRRVHPLVNFFIAIFFISLGAQMELTAAQEHLFSAIIFSLFVLIGNPFIFIWIIVRMGYSFKTAFLAGVTVAQISEFSFIFAAVGLRAELIDPSILSLISLIGLITIAVSSYMILYNEELYQFFIRVFPRFSEDTEDIDSEKVEDDLSNHIIIIGMNTLGQRLAKDLHSRGQKLVLIDTDMRKLEGLEGNKVVGNVDSLALLEEVKFRRAKLVISTLHIADTNTLLAYRCQQHNTPVAVNIFDESVKADLEAFNLDFHLDPRSSVVEKFNQIAISDGSGR